MREAQILGNGLTQQGLPKYQSQNFIFKIILN